MATHCIFFSNMNFYIVISPQLVQLQTVFKESLI